MADRTQFRLGLVGYGEIGSTLGAGLRGAGLESIACYDKYAFDGPYADLIKARARDAGVTLVRSNGDLAEAADLIVSVTPGASSLESADAFAPVLTSRHTFLDFASATPKIKQTVAQKLEASGALLGDGSIEGTPLHGYSMRMLSSGPAGERVCDLLNPWGMQIAFTGPAGQQIPGQLPALPNGQVVLRVAAFQVILRLLRPQQHLPRPSQPRDGPGPFLLPQVVHPAQQVRIRPLPQHPVHPVGLLEGQAAARADAIQ